MEPLKSFRSHLLLYLCEAAELAIFMLSACVFTVILAPIPNPWLSRTIMGTAMGLTAIAIIKSPMGKASGAHFNPAITLTFCRLGKIDAFDATFYILFQFLGGIFGVWISKLLLGPRLAAVHYAVTIPGLGGTPAAFAAELFMAALLMAVVLITSNRPRLARYTTWLVGFLIANYILFLAPVSGFSINPARTLGSAVFAHIYTGLWIYFTAPILGMMLSAEIYLRKTTRSQPYFAHRYLEPKR
jgi:aquaporin Z